MLWVDDYGALPLRKKDVTWYHENAGPISCAFEWDDMYPWSLAFLSNATSGVDFSFDYLSYHFHPLRYRGSKFLKRVYDRLRMYSIVYSLIRALPVRINKWLFRACALGVFLLLVGLLLISLRVNLIYFGVGTGLLSLIGLLACAWYCVQYGRNSWDYPVSESDWIKDHIMKANAEFSRRGIQFPTVIRHGWNLPWKDSMEFYRSLGVRADASCVPHGKDSRPSRNGREIKWQFAQPYYTSITHDYKAKWDGVSEVDKGLLELPVMLGNITAYGFGDKEKQMIDHLPDGGLVSVYIHPQDDFSTIKEWVIYLKSNFDVRFIGAQKAYEIFSDVDKQYC